MKTEDKKAMKDTIVDMVVTGYTQRDIAHKLGITRRTVCRYVDENRKEIIKELRGDVPEQIADMETINRKRVKNLWIIALDNKQSSSDRTSAIALLQKEEVLSVKRKQMVGLLPQDGPAVAIQNTNVVEGVTTIADSIRRLHPELMDKFKSNKTRVIQGKINEKKD